MEGQIFISYSRQDLDDVKSIKEELEGNGFSCWMDLEGIESGSREFTQYIIDAIDTSTAFLFFLSTNSQKSEWALKEIDYAKDERKHVVLVRYNDEPMTKKFRFDFGRTDIIDWRKPEQKGKLLRDLRTWMNEINESNEAHSPTAMLTSSKESVKTQTEGSFVTCPICGKKNNPVDTFRCRKCGQDNLCLRHQDNETYFCNDCKTSACGGSVDASLKNICGDVHCSIGAICENDETKKVKAALNDPEKTCLVQIASAVRVAVGEAFGMKPGELTTGKVYAALRRLFFDKVFDTNFAADVTIMEDVSEFIKRFCEQTDLPLITSCCSACTEWMEKYAPDFTGNLSTAKAPQQMLSALCKSYWAEKHGIDHKKIHVTSIMPCPKKYEIGRDEFIGTTGTQDADVVLTTNDLASMIKAADIDFASLLDEPADMLLGEYTGAATIFGVTGGVMEAVLRTAYCLITSQQPPRIEFQAVRGMDGVKTATIDIKGTKVNIAVAHQMGNVEKVLDMIRADRKNGVKPRFDFIEVMACRGGCIGGGGQPGLATDEVLAQRTEGLYADDEKCTLRMSHLNPEVVALYKDYLGGKTGAQGGKKAHHLLHTKHKKDVRYGY